MFARSLCTALCCSNVYENYKEPQGRQVRLCVIGRGGGVHSEVGPGWMEEGRSAAAAAAAAVARVTGIDYSPPCEPFGSPLALTRQPAATAPSPLRLIFCALFLPSIYSLSLSVSAHTQSSSAAHTTDTQSFSLVLARTHVYISAFLSCCVISSLFYNLLSPLFIFVSPSPSSPSPLCTLRPAI